MYKTGDHVFYPKGGVFVIETQSDKTIAGRSITFFDLKSCDGKTKISIPIENVDRVGVRPLVSTSQLEECRNTWAPDLKISKLHHKNRKSRFEGMRQSGNFVDMGKVVVTIHHLIKKTKATFEEKRMYDQIRKRLVDEIEIVKNWPTEKADDLLTAILDEAILRKPPKDEGSDQLDPTKVNDMETEEEEDEVMVS
jgi:CarD family transcriptional regulator